MKRGWVLAGGLLLAGCAGVPYEEEALCSPDAPPTPKVEIPGPPETPGQAWVPGRWVRGEEGWAWQTGRYVQTSEEILWVPGTWKKDEDAGTWMYAPGAWCPLRAPPPEEAPAPESAVPESSCGCTEKCGITEASAR
jgi:hypothetical protein